MNTSQQSGVVQVGWIGLGSMGGPMARNVVEAGCNLLVFDTNAEAVSRLTRAGARAAIDLKQLASAVDVVFVCLPSKQASESVAAQVFSASNPPAVYVELSTLAPGTMQTLGRAAAAARIEFLDAPVSGRKQRRDAGELAVWVGGSKAAFERVLPIMRTFGNKITHLGPVGAGCIAKLSHNLIGITTALTIMEGLLLGVRNGIPMDTLCKAVMDGASGTPMMRYLADLYMSRSYRDVDSPEIPLRLAVKDMELAVQLGRDTGFPVHTAIAALEVWRRAADSGLADQEIFSVFDYLELHSASPKT